MQIRAPGTLVNSCYDYEVTPASAILGEPQGYRRDQRSPGRFQTRAQVIYRDGRAGFAPEAVGRAEAGEAGVYPALARVVTRSDCLLQQLEDRRNGSCTER